MNSEPKHIGQPSVDAQILEKKLKEFNKPGDTVTYVLLAKAIGLAPDSPKFRGYLATARRIALREHGLVFEPMSGDSRGEGLVCLNDDDKVNLPSVTMRRIGRVCRRTAQKVATAAYEKLTPEQQRKYNTGLSFLGTLNVLTKPASQARIEGAVTLQPKRLDFSETIALFTK